MKSSYKWLIFLLIVSGLLIEFLKTSADRIDYDRPEGLSAAQIAQMDIRPYHNSDKNDETRSIRNRSNKKYRAKKGFKWPENHTFDHKAGKDAVKKKTAKKKKKEDDKKKKKKKKDKSDSKTTVAKNQKEFGTDENDNNEPPQDGTSGDEVVVGGFINPPAEEPETDLPLGYEEWAELVLNKPSLKATTKMVNYYQTNLVSSEVYFAILNAMAEDERSEMRELAVLAAGSTPSYNSFIVLNDLVTGEKSGTKVHEKATRQINEYTNPGLVNVLNHVIRASISEPDKTTLKRALALLQESAQKNLNEQNIIQSDDGSQSFQRYGSKYFGLQNTLERTINTHSADPEISSTAQDTLNHILSFVS